MSWMEEEQMLKVKWGPQVTSCDRRWNFAIRSNLFHSTCNSLPLGSLCFQFWVHHSFSRVLDLWDSPPKTHTHPRARAHLCVAVQSLLVTALSYGVQPPLVAQAQTAFLPWLTFQDRSHCCKWKTSNSLWNHFIFVILVNILSHPGQNFHSKKTLTRRLQSENRLVQTIKYF